MFGSAWAPVDGLALGGKTYKLKIWTHGGNHPVQQDTDGKVEITATYQTSPSIRTRSIRARSNLPTLT